MQQNPKVIDFCTKPVPYYEDLVDLFECTYVTGDYALSSDEPCPTDFVIGPNASSDSVSDAAPGTENADQTNASVAGKDASSAQQTATTANKNLKKGLANARAAGS